jgi:hypothetical protein
VGGGGGGSERLCMLISANVHKEEGRVHVPAKSK